MAWGGTTRAAMIRPSFPIAVAGSRRRFSSVTAKKNDVTSPESDVITPPKMPAFDYSPAPYTGPSASEILRKRKKFLSPAMPTFFKHPLNLVDGRMQYLYDENGRRYLDALGGIATVGCGHCHPDVVNAIVTQTQRLQHSTVLYLNASIADFAEALASKMPGDLKVVFFTNSGTEANELALLMARLYTGCHDIISLKNSYHGNAAATMGATALGNYKFNVIQGIGNGIPLGAVVTTPEIANVLTRRNYFNTFGGNPVCTAAGHAVLRVIEKERLQENALAVGTYLKERLITLKDKYELIGDVRGKGLMLGVELVTDHEKKTPAKAETDHVMDQMKDMGVLIGKGGSYGNVFRITPPLCFTKQDSDFLVDVMDYVMAKMWRSDAFNTSTSKYVSFTS